MERASDSEESGSKLFEGSRNLEEIENFKERILGLARFHQVEKFLFYPVEELLPDPKKYIKDDPAEQRQLDQDSEKIYEMAAKAYALVKENFKPNSQAAAVIKPAEETGRLDILWKLFISHYDNPGTKSGAERLIRAFYETPQNKELINLFLLYTEHYNRIDAIAHSLQQPRSSGKSIVSLLTPRKIGLQTPALNSQAADSTVTASSTFPQ